MSERPDNYESVLNEAVFRRKFSVVRWECMLERIEAVLKGEKPEGFEGWNPEHIKALKEDLANQ